MRKLQFAIEIDAPKDKVWEALWKDDNYRKWAAEFHEGSFYESDLAEGSEILFLTPERDGMYGIVEKNVPFEKMFFRHRGEIQKGEKQPETYGEEAIEQYDLTEENGVTNLAVTLNTPEEYLQYFTQVFPAALQKVKEIAES